MSQRNRGCDDDGRFSPLLSTLWLANDTSERLSSCFQIHLSSIWRAAKHAPLRDAQLAHKGITRSHLSSPKAMSRHLFSQSHRSLGHRRKCHRCNSSAMLSARFCRALSWEIITQRLGRLPLGILQLPADYIVIKDTAVGYVPLSKRRNQHVRRVL